MQLLVPSFPIRPVLIAAVGIAFSVSLGFLTTMTALLATLMHTVGAFTADTDAALIFTSIALTLLGPGAYSLDARLFGRRLIFESHRYDDSN